MFFVCLFVVVVCTTSNVMFYVFGVLSVIACFNDCAVCVCFVC